MSGKKSVVKNRAPAPIQITAEQILREASERKEATGRVGRRKIEDEEELDEYRMSKRKTFEDTIRRQREHMGNWIKYAQWEESMREFERARSIYERALDVDYKNHSLWLKYAEMEMKNKFVNHARNIWDRAVTLHPRVAQFWYKYAFMEEMIGNVDAARAIFERWMEWQPDDQAWYSYIKLETRAGERARARAIYERYLMCHVAERAYLKFAMWEEKSKELARARAIYERALVELRPDERSEKVYIAFAAFEERCKEMERARAIFTYALDSLPKDEAVGLYNAFIAFEKQHGDRKRIDDVVVAKRRVHYEGLVAANPLDYDSWFEYAQLEENEGDGGLVREVYERAIANVPPIAEKAYWRRYIFLWIKYAVYMELIADSKDEARQVYEACLRLVPHATFTFSKIWVLLAKFLLRQRDVAGCRKVLGEALGRCPTPKLYRSYIGLEWMMGEVDRVRTLYEKWLQFSPHNCAAWKAFADVEKTVGEVARARAIFGLAIGQAVLDKPEMIWKAFIDFETELGETDRARELYERLLERTKHVKVWVSFAQFEATTDADAARDVYQRAYNVLKEEDKTEERVALLEAWLEMEEGLGDTARTQAVRKKMPRRVQKQRMAYAEDGSELGLEEYTDYLFPDDEKAQSNLKLLQAAQAWSLKRAHAQT
ncbi:pre-mRNA-splicing factor, Crooked neck-like protein [Achlya hypogyna]|uniref:Pre-mRNA-splicing factor, Crooked neck-like protein n=1 Tax=Achlya hypogyna TaxID=1202772 RepID=A0A1V9ZGY3_ACHHY|nr:pre-mRNA-splicing factor, Crooked neck-like protein [Achlya hypogyna]